MKKIIYAAAAVIVLSACSDKNEVVLSEEDTQSAMLPTPGGSVNASSPAPNTPTTSMMDDTAGTETITNAIDPSAGSVVVPQGGMTPGNAPTAPMVSSDFNKKL